MKFALAIIGLILAALVVPFLIPGAGQQAGVDPAQNLPWQITRDTAGQTTVFGLRPGQSPFAQARQAFGDDVELAIIAAPNEVGSLEAYYTQVPLGFVLARVILTLEVTPQQIEAMRSRALKAEAMESTTRKISLHPDDRLAAQSLPIRAISVIPTVNLDEATLISRFGEPGERLAVSGTRTHLLYPVLGLDIVVDAKGKELLQYVPPAEFERWLRGPLRVATADTGAKRSSE